MAEVTRLTRSGNLREATALIQRLLNRAEPQAAARTEQAEPVIQGSYHVVDEAADAAQRATQQSSAKGSSTQRSAANDRAAQAKTEEAEHPVGGSASAEHVHAASQGPKWWQRLRALLRAPGHAEPSPNRPQNRPSTHIAPGEPPPYVADEQELTQNRPSTHIAPGERFIESVYTNLAGTRAYKLYIPSGYQGQALPLVVMLHGCTQDPDDAAAGTRLNALAETELFLVAYPAQAASANRNKCWNWFVPSDQQRDSGEPSIIAGITRAIVRDYKLDARRVYVAGLSAGGAMAAIMGSAYPDIYAAIGVHSGLAYGAAHDLPSAFAAMQKGGARVMHSAHGLSSSEVVPTIVFHGDHDRTVHPRNGEQVLEQSLTHGQATKPRVNTERGQVPNGRSYTHSVYHDADGAAVMEQWLIHGAGHAWSGGSKEGSYTDPKGPDATREMVRFFYEHSK
ncbi:MAG: PHB depolymerase family esterase [Burkholderiales bacterium]|nr:PHB depolymerase family esterase [Burkholderiales bacterium]